jgi:hypothetical protein
MLAVRLELKVLPQQWVAPPLFSVRSLTLTNASTCVWSEILPTYVYGGGTPPPTPLSTADTVPPRSRRSTVSASPKGERFSWGDGTALSIILYHHAISPNVGLNTPTPVRKHHDACQLIERLQFRAQSHMAVCLVPRPHPPSPVICLAADLPVFNVGSVGCAHACCSVVVQTMHASKHLITCIVLTNCKWCNNINT